MKKIFLILILLPFFSFSQFGKWTSDGQAGVYWNGLNYPGYLGGSEQVFLLKPISNSYFSYTYEYETPFDSINYPYLSDSIYDNYRLINNSVGAFYNFKSRWVFNKRINLAAEYFWYKVFEPYDLNSNSNPSWDRINWKTGEDLKESEFPNLKGYFRAITGLGIPVYYGPIISTDFNVNNISYFGSDGYKSSLDFNFTAHMMLCQFVIGYEMTPTLPADFKGFLMLDESQNPVDNIEFSNFYISLRAAITAPFGDGTYEHDGTLSFNAIKPTQGCIKGNCTNGKGVYVDSEGRYKGRFKEGKRHGKGYMSFSNGSTYDGQWRRDNRHGKGTFISSYNEKLSGDWINDEFADPKLKPELIVRNIVFKDSDGDDEIYAEENGKINFTLENLGEGAAYNIIFSIKDLNNTRGLFFDERIRIEKLRPGQKEKISIPISSDLDLKTGLVNIKISADELNGFPPDDVSLSFKSLAYINPKLEIIDHKFSSLEEGKNTLMVNDRAQLSFIVQNRGQGRAEDVEIMIDFTSNENIFNVDDKLVTIKSLKPNESKTVNFEFFTNARYDKKNIGISVLVNEKFGKYGDKRILSKEIGEEIKSDLIVNYDGSRIREEVVIDNLSLTSAVDKNIPRNSKVNNRYALIIGNEDYQSRQSSLSFEQNVDYAVNDASIFKEYALKTLGVKEENMHFLTNATAGEMNQEIDLVAKIIQKLGNKAELIVYYAGHGYPDELSKVPYLIPVDVSAGNLSNAIKLDDMYNKLAETGAKKTTIFLDACFTGGGRNAGLLASRGFKVKPKTNDLKGNLLVFSATSEEQSALPYHKEGHGMFTYHLLKKLQESKGKVSMGELSEYISDNVSLQSLKVNQKDQEPKIYISPNLRDNWKNWEF